MENIASKPRASKVSSRKKEGFDQFNMLIEIELNDWLNDVLRQTKRQNGKKLNKSDILNALIAWFKENQPNWGKISSLRELEIYLNHRLPKLIN